MLNATPYEVIAAPFTVWVAAVGAVFPSVGDEPDSSDWTLVGSSGSLNYDDAGVKVEHKQSMAFWRSLGDSGSRKVFRSTEDLVISLELVDVTLEQYALALNGNAVTPNTGEVKLGLSRGLTVDTRALLVRGPSPYVADGAMQFEVPIAVQTGSPQVVFKRDDPAGLALEWTALVDPAASSDDERFGRLVAETSET